MSTNKQLELALDIAIFAHRNVTRQDGDPYIFHPLRVASNTTYIKTKKQKAIALLHDVLEDTPISIAFLHQKGVSRDITDVLVLLTHKESEDYDAYIERIATNIDAMLVKLADLDDNLRVETLAKITEKEELRIQKYKNAKNFILQQLEKNYPEWFEKNSESRFIT